MYRYFPIILFLVYIVAMTMLMIWQGIGIAPDRYAFVLLLASLFVKRTRTFLLDWIPFLFILISYDFLRGFADILGQRVHFTELINADIAIFGNVSTVVLQNAFYQPGYLHWYDYYATIFYFLHFALPLAFGYFLWLKHRYWFREFAVALLFLSYSGWITYMLYPAAPPWLAHEQGYLSQVTKIMDHTLNVFPERVSLPTIYHKITPNQVAAIPSMHAAYPFLVLLFLLNYFRWKGLLFIPYVISAWLSIIYTGEHYAIDAILGAFYATIAFVITKTLFTHKDPIKAATKTIFAKVATVKI